MRPKREVDVAIVLNYYAPYVSGLTETAKVLAEGLAERGWKITVVTTRHDRALSPRETVAGVDVIRRPVIARVGKGTISPGFLRTAARVARAATLVNLHMPMLEAGLIARAAGDVPVVATYQCDVALPAGVANTLQVKAVDRSSRAALRRARVVVPSTADYAEQSRLWTSMRGRTLPISPPCQDRSAGEPTQRDGDGLHVGFLGRIVEEKGLEYLVEGFLRAATPADRLLIGGDYTNVAGGSVIDRVRACAHEDPRVKILGFLPDSELADFYASLDVFALPSVNSLEAFGIVQVEAMMAGVAAIASDIPGVRTPVQNTGFGRIVAARSASAIADAIRSLREDPPDRQEGARRTRELYGAGATIDCYESLFREFGAGPPRYG